MRQQLIAAVLTAILGLVPVAAMAAEAFVQEDHTPIVNKPGVGGKVLRWVDSGFPLVVVDRRGEWLRVEARRLDPPASEAWIPAARVGPVAPGAAAEAARAVETPQADFQLGVGGALDVLFTARCRVVEAGRDRLVAFRDRTPAAFQLAGDAVACRISNIDDGGYIQATLADADGRPIAGAPTIVPNRAVTLRSQGPWGAAGSFDAPLQFVMFRNPAFDNLVPLPPIIGVIPGTMVPPVGNPVPPIGNPVPPIVNPVSPIFSPVSPIFSPVSPIVSPVPAFGTLPVPAMGNPVPAFGSSPTPAFGSAPVRTMRGSPVTAFRGSSAFSSPPAMAFQPVR